MGIPIWDRMSLRDQFNLERLWRRRPVVSVIRFEGVIMPRQRRGGLSLASHAAAIERAFRASGLVAVAIVVNSPGGSPVQSALLYRRIRQLAEEKHVPVIAFAEDVAASGGYAHHKTHRCKRRAPTDQPLCFTAQQPTTERAE